MLRETTLGGGVGGVLCYLLRVASFFLFVALFTSQALSQCVVNSTTGYSVTTRLTPLEVIKPASCPWGYNYNLRIGYDISFSGNNIPSGLYTMQARISCGSQQLFFDLPNGAASGEVITTADPWRGQSDCATATPASLNCRNVVIEIEGVGISARNVNCSATLLPITLVSFDANSTAQGVVLSWTTAMERDNDYFTVERSADGVVYEEVLRIPSAGNAQAVQHYAATDPTPFDGTVYYRLRQTDLDGTTTYSDVVPVRARGSASTMVHPNPVEQGDLRLSGDLTTGYATIMDGTGAVVFNDLVNGRVPVARLAAGTYALHLLDKEGRSASTTKFIKQ